MTKPVLSRGTGGPHATTTDPANDAQNRAAVGRASGYAEQCNSRGARRNAGARYGEAVATRTESFAAESVPRHDHRRVMFTAAVLVSAALAFYAALVVFSRIDRLIMPSRQLRLALPSVSIGNVTLDPLPLVDTSDNYSPKDRINILVLGLDRRPYEGEACTRADTFFIVSLDSFNDTASILSFPRDLYVDLPDGQGGTYKQRINTTTVFGCGDKYPGGGPGLAKDTIQLNFGIHVDNHVMLDFEGFQSLIDSLGGIDIDVPEAISVGHYYFPTGMQHLNGEQALIYARLRPDGDFKRIERQQLVIVTAAKKALGLGLLNDPIGTYQQYANTVDSDIHDAKLPGLGDLAKKIGLDNVKTYSLACYKPADDANCVPALQSFTTSEGAAVQLPVWNLVFAIINQAMPDPGLQDENATIGIVGGGTEIRETARDYLIQRGIAPERIVTEGLEPYWSLESGVYRLGDLEYTAHRAAEWLDIDGGDVRTAEGVPAGPDVLIVLDEGYALPDGAVVRK